MEQRQARIVAKAGKKISNYMQDNMQWQARMGANVKNLVMPLHDPSEHIDWKCEIEPAVRVIIDNRANYLQVVSL
jgi:hypothetical protein